jgi:hypothetical protein
MESIRQVASAKQGWPRPGIQLPHWEHALQRMSLISHLQRNRGDQALANDVEKLLKVMIYQRFHCKINTESIACGLPDEFEPV